MTGLELIDHLQSALRCLEHLTSDEFALGGDRPARAAIVRALAHLGAADAEQLREYRHELAEDA